MVTVWSKRAKTELIKAYEYIREDSPQNAAKVRDEIIDISIDLPKHPEKHPPDKYKKGNNGTWRAFEIYHYSLPVAHHTLNAVEEKKRHLLPVCIS